MYRRENARCASFCLYIQAGAVRISVRAAFFFAGICQKIGGKEYYQNRWQSGKRYGRISVYRLWKIYCVSAEKFYFFAEFRRKIGVKRDKALRCFVVSVPTRRISM